MISVIVPIYKVEKYLEHCVDSIRRQTYSNLEIILVDDGSPDNCGAICDKLAQKDDRIRVIHQKNKGLSGARNTGLAAAKGEYVSFIDSDDTIHPEMYALLVSQMQEFHADLAICGHRIIREGATSLKSAPHTPTTIVLDKAALYEEIFGRLNNSVWNKLYRHELLKTIRFQEGTIHGEDLLFNLNYLTKCNLGVLNTSPMYNYLKRAGSITQSGFNEKRFHEITVKDHAFALIAQTCPEQINNALKYSFQARMNVIRSIHKAKKQTLYQEQILNHRQFIVTNYQSVRPFIRTKEKMEYHAFIHFPGLYKVIMSIIK